MLKHAEAGEWESVAEDEIKRRQLIDSFFSEPSNIAHEPEISTAIREMLKINDRLEKLTIDARDAARTRVSTINSGRKAVDAYTANSR